MVFRLMKAPPIIKNNPTPRSMRVVSKVPDSMRVVDPVPVEMVKLTLAESPLEPVAVRVC